MKEYSSFGAKLILWGKGIAMGAADIVPGVSGGTIALISGIYEHLIDAISSVQVKHALAAIQLPFLFWNSSKRKELLSTLAEVPWSFLLPLLIGILTGVLSMSRVIPFFMENYPFQTFSVFFGLIAFSILIPYKMMKHKPLEIIILVVFAVATFFLVGINTVGGLDVTIEPVQESQEDSAAKSIQVKTDEKGRAIAELKPGKYRVSIDSRYTAKFQVTIPESHKDEPVMIDSPENTLAMSPSLKPGKNDENHILFRATFSTKADSNYLYLFFSGAIAICAMILPGLSGAYLLVIMGQYRNILEALHQREFLLLGVLVAGMLVGILTFVRLLKYLLHNHKSITMAALTGILIGSLRKIWPFQYTEQYDTTAIFTAVLFALAGAVLLFLLEKFSVAAHDPEPPIADD